jgi:pimeloyl-ACP methyl ester carboxylesterase
MAAGLERVEVGGLHVAFRRAGSGPPLVLLHGALGDSREWKPQLDGLSDEFTVIAWDAPGHGESSDPPEAWRLPDYADCLAAMIERLGLERPHVLGLSFGGALALELFGRHPRLPGTLVLASAYAGWAGSLPADVVEERLQRALRDADRDPEPVAREFATTLFDDNTPPELVEEVVAIMTEFHPPGVRTAARALAEADLRHVLPRVDVPTLLLYADADHRSPLPVARDLLAAIPGSQLAVIPGVGHVTNLEAPERFNREVREFLRSAGAQA